MGGALGQVVFGGPTIRQIISASRKVDVGAPDGRHARAIRRDFTPARGSQATNSQRVKAPQPTVLLDKGDTL